MDTKKLILVGSAFLAGLFILWYLKRKSKNNYKTPAGQWVIKWDPPTGTPPFTYIYSIVDEKSKSIVSSTTTETTLVLDPTIFIPDAPPPTSLMSDKTYTATITPTNSVGAGKDDVFSFKIYDQPSMFSLQNYNTDGYIYPPGGADIFGTGSSYNQIVPVMILSLNDRVTPNGLVVSIVSNGKTYNPIQIDASDANSNGEASQWSIVWSSCPNSGNCPPLVVFNTGDQVSINISSSNPGGTFTWSNTYTVGPAPAQAPSSINAQLDFDPSL